MSGSSWPFVLYFLFLKLHSLKAKTINTQIISSKAQTCNESFATLEIVENCPENKAIFLESSKRKMCEKYPKCLGKTLMYHCVKSKENFVEVCAPNDPIVGSCCAVFDTGVGRVIADYNRPCAECPFLYQSADFYNYSTCVDTKRNNSLTESGCKHNSEYCMEPSSPNILIIVLATAAAAAAAICLAIFICYRINIKGLIKKEKRKGLKECFADEKKYLNGINNEPSL